ncbi:uncharacterized protein LOC113791865 [Dermatophagoides pteronyssinus]|uniref:uncharacterized protein LOC113791865 n=1 Tax=Dermatophagoides pteronyssinus TaxID=6956 RepID=UPI003F662D0F
MNFSDIVYKNIMANIMTSIAIFMVLFSGTLAQSLFVDYNDYSCGLNQNETNELIQKFKIFKKNSNGNENFKKINDFIEQARLFRDNAAKQMLEIDQQLLTLNVTQISQRIKLEQNKIQCEKLTKFSELLSMQLLAYEVGMFEFAEEIDPNIDFDRKMKNFLDETSRLFNLAEFDKLEKKFLNAISTKTLKDEIDGELVALNDFINQFLEDIIMSEFTVQSRYYLNFSIEDQVQIDSTLMTFSALKILLNDLKDYLEHLDN